MATREKEPKLQELFDEGVQVYSFSKLSTINQCLYGAYLTYKKHEKGKNSCYGIAGTATHDCLEKIINNEATEKDLLPTIQETLDELDMLGLPFPKDRNGGESIRDGWVADMTHFCKTFKAPKGNFSTEEFFLYKTDEDVYLQGYQDLIQLHNDETISILDWKTSSMYSKTDLLEHGRQLVIYLLAKEQEGKKVRKVAWIFLKYAEVKFLGKKTVKSKSVSEISKVIERKNIVKELERHIVAKLQGKGIEDIEIELIMDNAKETNEIPEQVVDQFKIIPYVMYYDITEEIKQECINYINNTVKMWENLGDDELEYPPRDFYKVQKNGKKVEDTFFCNTLCNHRDSCKYIKEHNEKIALEKASPSTEDDDLFG